MPQEDGKGTVGEEAGGDEVNAGFDDGEDDHSIKEKVAKLVDLGEKAGEADCGCDEAAGAGI